MNLSPSANRTRAHDQLRIQYLQLTIVNYFYDVVDVHAFMNAIKFNADSSLDVILYVLVVASVVNAALSTGATNSLQWHES